jgi:hypothetical protein
MKDSTVIYVVAILSIAYLQSVAMFILHIDGLLLSGAIGTILTIALKRSELTDYYGRIKSNLRNSDRGCSSSP